MSRTIHVSVPATLEHKELVLQATNLAARASREEPERVLENACEPADPFAVELVSALSALVNNITVQDHADDAGTMEFTFTSAAGYVGVEIRESGASFDVGLVTSPALEARPECGKGLSSVRSFIDELCYEPATNVWSLVKYRSGSA